MCLFDVYKGGPRADRRPAPDSTDGPGDTGDQAPPAAPTNGATWSTDRERLWLRAIARFMRAAADDLGPDSPVGAGWPTARGRRRCSSSTSGRRSRWCPIHPRPASPGTRSVDAIDRPPPPARARCGRARRPRGREGEEALAGTSNRTLALGRPRPVLRGGRRVRPGVTPPRSGSALVGRGGLAGDAADRVRHRAKARLRDRLSAVDADPGTCPWPAPPGPAAGASGARAT